MAAFVTDTHAALWSILQPEKLSTAARAAFEEASLLGDPVYLASISMVETRYLEEKGKLRPGTLARLKSALEGDDAGFVLVPLNLEVTEALGQIPRDAVPDMPDRIIAATALYLNLPLVTRDRQIQVTTIPTIW